MTANNFRILALAIVFTVATFAAAIGDDDNTKAEQKAAAKAKAQRVRIEKAVDAQELLERSMRMARSVNVIAIVTKCGDGSEVLQQLKIEQRAMGDQLRQVLQPLSMQGVTYLDSGKKSFMYLPDQK